MIRVLISAGYRLAGKPDPRLNRGLCWAAVDGFLAAAPYGLLYGLVTAVFDGSISEYQALAYGSAMAVCVVLRILAARAGMTLIFSGAYAMMAQARLRVADHLRRVPMGWFSGQRQGDLAARMTSDLALVEQLWSHFLGVFISGLVTAVALWLLIAWVDWRIALLMLASILLAVGALAWTHRRMAVPVAQLLETGVSAQAGLQEYLRGVEVMRAYGATGVVWQRLVKVLEAHHAAQRTAEARPAPWLAAYGLLLEGGYVAIVIAAVGWLAAGTLAVGDWALCLVLALPAYRQLFDMGLAVLLLRFAQRALDRIDAMLAVPLLPEPVWPQPPTGRDVVLADVRFRYTRDRPWTLDRVSCTLPAGQLTAIVGPSGAGKSTLLHLVARLWDTTSGVVRVGGVDVRLMGSDLMREHVAVVFQDVWLYGGSVMDNLRLARPLATLTDVQEAVRLAGLHEVIDALPQGYDTLLGEGGRRLSGGERQRLSIARAVLKDAPIVLFDEPASAMDATAEIAVGGMLRALARDRTIVVVAHRLRTVMQADQILVLDAGRLVAQGRHDELMAAGGVYARLWSHQQAGRFQ